MDFLFTVCHMQRRMPFLLHMYISLTVSYENGSSVVEKSLFHIISVTSSHSAAVQFEMGSSTSSTSPHPDDAGAGSLWTLSEDKVKCSQT